MGSMPRLASKERTRTWGTVLLVFHRLDTRAKPLTAKIAKGVRRSQTKAPLYLFDYLYHSECDLIIFAFLAAVLCGLCG